MFTPIPRFFPQIGQRVMIDDSSVVIGDVRLADDVGISGRSLRFVEMYIMYRSEHAPISRMAVCCMSLINPRTTQMATH